MHVAIAWWVTLLCVLFSARIATAFLRQNPRMFTAMALFACSWTNVLGYYSSIDAGDLADFLSDLAAFLDVYVGALLMLDARDVQEKEQPSRIVPLQSLGLFLLLFIAAPRAIEISVPHGPQLGLTLSHTKSIVGFVLDITAFVSIAVGARGISGYVGFMLLAVILGLYGSCEAGYTVFRWYDAAASEPMPLWFAIAFILLKIAFTVTLGCIVALHGMTDDMRTNGFRHWALHFFYLAP